MEKVVNPLKTAVKQACASLQILNDATNNGNMTSMSRADLLAELKALRTQWFDTLREAERGLYVPTKTEWVSKGELDALIRRAEGEEG